MTLYEIVPYNYDRAPIGVPTSMMLVEVEPTVIQELCIYHHRQVRKHMAHCEAVWTESADCPNGDCVTAQFALVPLPKEDTI